jgi:hypothetical protein
MTARLSSSNPAQAATPGAPSAAVRSLHISSDTQMLDRFFGIHTVNS